MTRLSIALELAGLAAISAGVAFVFWPGALVVAGLGLIVMAQGMGAE